MKKIEGFLGKKVLVLGLGISGSNAAELLHRLGAEVIVNDAGKLNAPALEALGIKVVTGQHTLTLLEEVELLVKNPGIPYENVMVQGALERGIPVVTEIELAYMICEAPILAITGTNGKTTTTTMIHKILNADGKSAALAGNIGISASKVAQEVMEKDILVMETSSFQLAGTRNFHPHLAVITNIYSTHLDYHGSQTAYEAAKWKIQANMTAEDFLVLNFNQEKMRAYAKKTRATVIPTSTQKTVDGAYQLDSRLYFKGEYIMDSTALSLPGEHNIENALFAIAATKLFGVSNEAIVSVLSNFEGVRHRMQYLGEVEGRRAYNDSEATNIAATKKALTAFDNSRLWLFVGGLDRGNEFDELESSLIGLKGIVIMGETKGKFRKIAEKYQIPCFEADDIDVALKKIFPKTKAGDVLLLSPACASWDHYKNAEERGDIFIQAFDMLKESAK